MKKAMFTLVAAVSATILAEDITTDIVGYSKTPEIQENKFFIGNAPFCDIGSTDGTVTIANLVNTDATPGEYSTMEEEAPMIEVLQDDGISYNLYYLITDAYDADSNSVTGWADDYGDLAIEAKIACGTAFWYKSVGGASDLTMPGGVLEKPSVTKVLRANGFNLIGNPYPTELTFDKVSQTFTPGEYSTMEEEAPMIEVLQEDGISYNLYYLITDAYDADSNSVTGWANEYGDLMTEPIVGVSQGFWVRLYNEAEGNTDFTVAK